MEQNPRMENFSYSLKILIYKTASLPQLNACNTRSCTQQMLNKCLLTDYNMHSGEHTTYTCQKYLVEQDHKIKSSICKSLLVPIFVIVFTYVQSPLFFKWRGFEQTVAKSKSRFTSYNLSCQGSAAISGCSEAFTTGKRQYLFVQSKR